MEVRAVSVINFQAAHEKPLLCWTLSCFFSNTDINLEKYNANWFSYKSLQVTYAISSVCSHIGICWTVGQSYTQYFH